MRIRIDEKNVLETQLPEETSIEELKELIKRIERLTEDMSEQKICEKKEKKGKKSYSLKEKKTLIKEWNILKNYKKEEIAQQIGVKKKNIDLLVKRWEKQQKEGRLKATTYGRPKKR